MLSITRSTNNFATQVDDAPKPEDARRNSKAHAHADGAWGWTVDAGAVEEAAQGDAGGGSERALCSVRRRTGSTRGRTCGVEERTAGVRACEGRSTRTRTRRASATKIVYSPCIIFFCLSQFHCFLLVLGLCRKMRGCAGTRGRRRPALCCRRFTSAPTAANPVAFLKHLLPHSFSRAHETPMHLPPQLALS
ncbi:hypothetical protein C8R45DRAFT_252333 [Mycena sanguinolenta]|nr:hypothetical protein C8R45DRAFT_252333 [Mycena sanguinolenta]